MNSKPVSKLFPTQRRIDEKAEQLYGYFVVGYFDLLGQSNALQKLSLSPDDNSLPLDALRDTVGKVEKFRSGFISYFSGMRKPMKLPGPIPKGKEELAKDLRSDGPLWTHAFSDTFVAFSPFADQFTRVPTSAIFAMFGAAAQSIFVALATNTAVRGAIEVGQGAKLKDGDLYGKVLADTYLLESKTANWPRIVIGKELTNFLYLSCKNSARDPVSEFNRQMSAMCQAMISTDKDGIQYLDFAGSAMKEAMFHGEAVKDGQHLYSRAKRYAESEFLRFSSDGNEKLRNRYELLKTYFEQRQRVWLS